MTRFSDFITLLGSILSSEKEGVFHMKTYWDVMVVFKINCDYTKYNSDSSYSALQMTANTTLHCKDEYDVRERSFLNDHFLGHAYSSCTKQPNETKTMRFYGILRYQLFEYLWLNPVCFIGEQAESTTYFEPVFEYSMVPIDFGTRALIYYFNSSEAKSGKKNTTMAAADCFMAPRVMERDAIYLDRQRLLACNDSGAFTPVILLWSWASEPTCGSYTGSGALTEIIAFWPASNDIPQECLANSSSNQLVTPPTRFRRLFNFTKDLFNSHAQRMLLSQSVIDARHIDAAYLDRIASGAEEGNLIVTRHFLQFSCSCVCIYSKSYGLDPDAIIPLEQDAIDSMHNPISLAIISGYPESIDRNVGKCAEATNVSVRHDTSVVRDYFISKPCYLSAEFRREKNTLTSKFALEASFWHSQFASPSTYACSFAEEINNERRCDCGTPRISSSIHVEHYRPRIIAGYNNTYYLCYCSPMDGLPLDVKISVTPPADTSEERKGVVCQYPGVGCISYVEMLIANRIFYTPLDLRCRASHRNGSTLVTQAYTTYRHEPSAFKMEVLYGFKFFEVVCFMQISLYLHNLTVSAGSRTESYPLSLEAGVQYKITVKSGDMDDRSGILCKCSVHSINGWLIQSAERMAGNPRINSPTLRLAGKVGFNTFVVRCKFKHEAPAIVRWRMVTVNGEKYLTEYFLARQGEDFTETSLNVTLHEAMLIEQLFCNVSSAYTDESWQSDIHLAYEIGTPTVRIATAEDQITVRIGDPYEVTCNYSGAAVRSAGSVEWNIEGAKVVASNKTNTRVFVVSGPHVRITCSVIAWDTSDNQLRIHSQPLTLKATDEKGIYVLKDNDTCTRKTNWRCEIYCVVFQSTFTDLTTISWYADNGLFTTLKPKNYKLPFKNDVTVLGSKAIIDMIDSGTTVACERKIDINGVLPIRSRDIVLQRSDGLNQNGLSNMAMGTFPAVSVAICAAIFIIFYFVKTSKNGKCAKVEQSSEDTGPVIDSFEVTSEELRRAHEQD